MFSPDGQNWGLAPLSPIGLIETAYESFIQSLRANMRHAGAIRIDHVMALQHLYWIPEGKPASEGMYIGYPMDDMVGMAELLPPMDEARLARLDAALADTAEPLDRAALRASRDALLRMLA